MPRVALVTCSELPDLHADDQLLLAPLREHGITVTPAVWDDPAIDWDVFDLAVLRSTWDYTRRREQFLSWAHSVPRLANPAKLVEWNTDKRYLRALSAAAVAVVPTTWLEPGDPLALPDSGEYVVKPAVGAGSIDTGRYRLNDAAERALAEAHAARLLDAGATVMLQPYLTAVDTAGETAMLYVGGRFSHAIRKGPMLDGPDPGAEGLFREELIEPREPSDAEREIAQATYAAIPGSQDDLLYARIDLIPADDASPIVLEVELTEPSMFLSHASGAAGRLAQAIAARL